MLRSLRLLLFPALLVVSLAAAPAASAASNCQRGQERKLGATYVTKISTKVVTCAVGRDVVKAFHRCRRANGGADGKCTSKVKGYSCTEKRPAALKIDTQYTGQVSCKTGSKRVTQEYQQNT